MHIFIGSTRALGADAADFLLLAPPAQHMRTVTSALHSLLERGTPVVSCSKGIERGSLALMPEVLAETLLQARIAVLSGPSFAREIAIDLPCGVTLACADTALAKASPERSRRRTSAFISPATSWAQRSAA